MKKSRQEELLIIQAVDAFITVDHHLPTTAVRRQTLKQGEALAHMERQRAHKTAHTTHVTKLIGMMFLRAFFPLLNNQLWRTKLEIVAVRHHEHPQA